MTLIGWVLEMVKTNMNLVLVFSGIIAQNQQLLPKEWKTHESLNGFGHIAM